jgi:dihydrofolate synthase / folylpolyglutamate synthase
MTYPAVKQYLNSFINYEKDTNYSYAQAIKLKRIRDFLAIIGDPQNSLRIIHIAGTKGKGSTSAMVAYILREAGFNVGLYTSPHLNDFRERIRILKPVSQGLQLKTRDFEGAISKKQLGSLVEELKPLIDKYNRSSKYGMLSFFEVYTALAFLYFKRRQIDFAVLETGMGGRLDATNSADSLVCGITPLSFEHVQKLGNTLSRIAVQKAGIIKKKGAIVVSAAQTQEARQVIRNRCQKFQARLYEVGNQIKYFRSGKYLAIKGLKNNYRDLRLNLLGKHQEANAALAVGLVEGLNFSGFNVPALAIARGLGKTVWPGRCEVVQRNPLVVLDGAQNLASARVLKKAVRNSFKYRKVVLVLGISSDKDIQGICQELDSLADAVILTSASTPRAVDAVKLAGYFKRKIYLTSNVKEAKFLASKLAGRNDLILVTGSLFVVGEFRNDKR